MLCPLLQKPTDLGLHCLQRQDISGFSRTRINFLNMAPLCLAWQKNLTDGTNLRDLRGLSLVSDHSLRLLFLVVLSQLVT